MFYRAIDPRRLDSPARFLDNGHRGCHGLERIPRYQHVRLDGVGLVRCACRRVPHLGLYGKNRRTRSPRVNPHRIALIGGLLGHPPVELCCPCLVSYVIREMLNLCLPCNHSGNDHYLFKSAYYWFGIILTFFVAMIPRYMAKAYRVLYEPNDIDIMRIVHKMHPDIDLEGHPLLGGRWSSDGVLKPYDTVGRSTSVSHRGARDEEDQFPMQQRSPTRPTLPGNTGTRTDMSTGLPMTDRGFDFSQEEGGVAIRRIQTNLSEHHDPMRKQGSVRRRVSRLIPSPLRRSVHHQQSKRPTLPLSQVGSDTT